MLGLYTIHWFWTSYIILQTGHVLQKKEQGTFIVGLFSHIYIYMIVVYIKRNEFQRRRDPAEDLEVNAHQSVLLAELLQ